METTGRLLIRTASSDPDFNGDLDLGVVELTHELAALVLERHRLVLALHDPDRQLCHIAWWDCSCTFGSTDLDDFDDDWVLEPLGASPMDFEPQRTEIDEMRIDDTNVWWSCSPRHLDIVVETLRVPIAAFETWLREHETHAASSGLPHTGGTP